MSRSFLAMWDQHGLECLFDITGMDHKLIMSMLKGEKFTAPFNIVTMILRARYNSQRHYEIYTFNADNDIDSDTVKQLFDTDPQFIVDFIRREGRQLYSDRVSDNSIKIR